MLDTAMLPHESGQCRMHRTVARASVEERLATNVMPARYLDGWAEAGPAKIADATPTITISTSTRWPLLETNIAAVLHPAAFAFFGSGGCANAGPGVHPSRSRSRPLPRGSAPVLARGSPPGLTGPSEIVVTCRGAAAEAIAYDLNMACETLLDCGCFET